MPELKDYLNAINYTKEDLFDSPERDYVASKYSPFVVNRCLGSFMDTIMFVNEMNMRPQTDKDMQFHFLLNSIRKRKRFAKWLKAEKLDGLDAVKAYYECSDAKAKQILEVLDEEEVGRIKELTYPKGGKQQ